MLHMQNVEILSRVIMNDAHKEAELIIEKANRESESIRAKGIKTVDELKSETKNNFGQSIFSINKNKIISIAEFGAKNEILKQKDKIIENILNKIKQEFFSLTEHKDYPLVLNRLIIESFRYLEVEDKKFICRVNLRDQSLLSSTVLDKLSKRLNTSLSLDTDPLNIIGGVVLFPPGCRVLYDNSLEAIFERKKEDMRYIAATCTFNN